VGLVVEVEGCPVGCRAGGAGHVGHLPGEGVPDLPDRGCPAPCPVGARWCMMGHHEVIMPLPAAYARPVLAPLPDPAEGLDPAEVEVEGFGEALSPAELGALVVLARGGSVGEAALVARVHRNTVARWRRPGARLDLALAGLRAERVAAVRLSLSRAAAAVADELVALALDPAAPPAVRVRAACAVLDRAGLGPCAEPVAPVVEVEPLDPLKVLARLAEALRDVPDCPAEVGLVS
jgi:hypothetical protein